MLGILTRLGRRKIETAAIATVAAVASVGMFPRDAYVASAAAARSASNAPATNPSTAAAPAKASFVKKEVAAFTNALSSRSSRATMGLPNLEHDRVDSWIKRFTTTQRSSFATYLKRMSRYEGMISKKLADRDMPQGLIFIAMIESGFNPTAKSPVKASGLWQFMSPTAKEYGLTVNRRVDERNNPSRSTDAALKYLNSLHKRFGSWYLAAAAYNTGQGRVARIMKQETGKTRGTDADYYRISHRLPQETRDYVPKMIAAARIGANPERYGFRAN
jgi:membrane-bound lytic murein transglycosylase D